MNDGNLTGGENREEASTASTASPRPKGKPFPIKGWLTVKEASKRLKTSRSTIANWIQSEAIPKNCALRHLRFWYVKESFVAKKEKSLGF